MEVLSNIKSALKNRIFLFIALGVIAIIIYAFTGHYIIFRNIIEFLTISISMSIVFISFTKNYRNYGLFNYIGFGFSFICFLNIDSFILINYAIQDKTIYYMELFMKLSINYLEYMVVILAILFLRYSPKIKTIILSYIFFEGIIIVAQFFSLRFNGSQEEYVNIVNHIWWYIVILFFISIILNIKYKKFMTKSENRYVYIYLILIFVCEIIDKMYLRLILGDPIIAHIIKYVAYYILFRGLNKNIIQDTYSSMYNNLIYTEHKNVQLNKILKHRLKMLDETNILLSKSREKQHDILDSISDGVIIFYNCKAYYANKVAEGFIGESINSMITLKDILKKFNLDSLNLCEDSFIVKSIEKEIDYQKKYLDIYIFSSDINSKVLLIKNMTEKVKHYVLKLELEKYLHEEKAKEQFFSNISHELRTPINIIYSSLQLKELYLREDNYDHIKENTRIIRQNCLRLTRTINNFIDSNKISEGYLKANFGIYNIVEIIENVSQATITYLEKMNINLIFDSTDEEIYIKCDTDFMQRVALNILSNAAKYGKGNGEILVYIYIKDNMLCISFKDDGKPISEKLRPYLFDKFTKVNKDLNRPKEGSGLGLYLSRGLIELQGGVLELVLDNKCGNEFLITFPYEELYKETSNNSFEMNKIMEKVDIEFSDIYIEECL